MDASRRDVHVHTVAALGRLSWQEVSGYGQRALVETTMGRYKLLIGERLRARIDAGRRTEATVGAKVLNRMLAAGRPTSVRARAAPCGHGERRFFIPFRIHATTLQHA